MIVLLAVLTLNQSGRLMTYEEYGRVRHSRPYVLHIKSESAEIIYFGVGHTRDPDDPQLKRAAELWQNLKPQMAFHEDATPRLQPMLGDSVRASGEPAWTAFMAKSDGIPISSLDPNREHEATFLATRFDPAVVKSMYALRSLYEYLKRPEAGRKNSVPATATLQLLRLSTIPALKGTPTNFEQLQSVVNEVAVASASAEFPSSDWFDPGMPKISTKFSDIARASSQFRDRWMLDRIAELVKQDKRIFITMGASHVVMQERAIRAMNPKAHVEVLDGR